AKLTQIPKVPGTDGRKMSKSYGNAIYLSDPPETVRQKVRPMVTDPARRRRTDPGNPDVCPVFDLHRIFTPPPDREYCATGCRTAAIGCLDCKDVLLKHLLPAGTDSRAAPGVRGEARADRGHSQGGLGPGTHGG